MSTLREVAARAGVSMTTVSNVIHGRRKCSLDTRTRVQTAIRELDYVPDRSAVALRGARQHTVSLIVKDTNSQPLGSPFLGELIAGLSEKLHEYDYELELKLIRCVDFVLSDVFRHKAGDGIVTLISGDEGELRRSLMSLNSLRKPMLALLCDSIAEIEDFAVVTPDVRGNALLLAEHLLARNVRRLLYVSGSDLAFYERQASILREVTADISDDVHIEHLSLAATSYRDVQRAIARVATSGDALQAIVGANDLIAIAAMKSIQELGRRVPEDLLVASMMSQNLTWASTPTLTSVDTRWRNIGRMAAANMIERIDSGTFSERVAAVSGALIRGESTRAGAFAP